MISNREIAFESIQETDEAFGTGIGGTKVFKVSFFGALCVAKELSGTVKEDHIKVGNAQNDMRDYFLGKYQPLIQLRHPNIVQFMGIYFKPPDQTSKIRPVMVMEKLESSLSTFLANTPSISNAIKVSILLDVSLGLRYLHAQKPAVVHCNLSSNNILLTSQLQAKISDVGLMANQNQSLKESPFMAPELRTGIPNSLLAKSTSDPSVDIFSFGAVVLHTIIQQPPEPLGHDPVRQSVGTPTEVERLHSQINQVAIRSKSLKSLVMVCLDNDPSKRPTIGKVSELLKRFTDKLPIVSKSPIVWQAEVEAVSEQKNDLEKKLANELKAKEQLQLQIEILLKLIQVNHSEFERIFKASEKNDSAKQAQVDQSQQISGSKLVKANSLQHCFSSSNASRNFQLVLKKDSSPNALNAAVEYAKFQSSLQDLPMADTKCPHHPNYELSKYCADCEVELCHLCSSNHQNHKVKFFSVLFVNYESTKSKIQQLLKEIETQKNKVYLKNREIQEKAKQSHEAV